MLKLSRRRESANVKVLYFVGSDKVKYSVRSWDFRLAASMYTPGDSQQQLSGAI